VTRRARVVDLGPDVFGLAEVGLIVDYEDRHEAKALGGYTWDAERKLWRFPASLRIDCQRIANRLNREHGFSVSAEEEQAAKRPTRTVDGKPRDLSAAIVAMFALLPPTVRRSTLAGLRRALHPDTGGDTVAMQALNDATSQLEL
jgi:hypothetical protein